MESIIPWNEVICFDAETKLDVSGLRAIYKTGCSRTPIYENKRENITGILLVKTMILCDPDPELTIKQFLTINFKKVAQPPQTPLYCMIH